MNRRRATAILVASSALLGALAVLPTVGRDTDRREIATTAPSALLTALTRTTMTSEIRGDGTDDETTVRKLAERYIEAVNSHDDATVAELNCAKAAPGLDQDRRRRQAGDNNRS